MNLEKALTLTDKQIDALTPKELAEFESELSEQLRKDSQANQIAYYQPVNDDARKVHLSTAKEFGIQGGNKSSKTGTTLAEAVIQMTSVIPMCLEKDYPREKIHPPIRVRVVVTSLESAWDINLKPKMQYFEWNGRPNEDGLMGDPTRGHWGFVPQRYLINGDWNQSWSEKHKLLTLNLNGDFGNKPGSTMHVMSQGQSLQEFNQGAFDLIIEDEIPPEEIHRANLIRAMERGGRVITSGTPPDDRSAAVTAAWFFDQVLAPGLAGSNLEETDAAVLWTENNPTLDASELARVRRGLTEEQARARFHGESIHLAGLILPGFTVKTKIWCYSCNDSTIPVDGSCNRCKATDIQDYCNTYDDQDSWVSAVWPTLFYMDPHQARPTACAWYKIDPNDNIWQVGEAEISGGASEVRDAVYEIEANMGWVPFWRKADPKITVQANQFATLFQGEKFTIRKAFEDVGFYFEDANTSFTVGRERLLDWMRPNPYTRAPRLRIHRECSKTIYQVTHFVWNPHGRKTNVSIKELPARDNSDFPALLRYLANDDPTYRMVEAVRMAEKVVVGAGGIGRNKATGW